MIRKCQQCGVEFNIKPSAVKRGRGKYCSRECAGKAQRGGEYRHCLICGERYYVIAYRLENGGGKYCSISCASQAAWEKGAHENLKNGQYIECAVCGEEFYSRQSHIEQGRECCSKSCAAKKAWSDGKMDDVHSNLKTGEYRQCLICGTEFYAQRGQIDKRRGLYCSHSCSSKASWQDGTMDGVFMSPTSIELATARALKQYHLDFEQEWRPDGYSKPFDFLVEGGFLIEVQGDYWHNLPGARERDAEKAQWAEDNGYRLVEIWEHEINGQGAESLIAERVLPMMGSQ